MISSGTCLSRACGTTPRPYWLSRHQACHPPKPESARSRRQPIDLGLPRGMNREAHTATDRSQLLLLVLPASPAKRFNLIEFTDPESPGLPVENTLNSSTCVPKSSVEFTEDSGFENEFVFRISTPFPGGSHTPHAVTSLSTALVDLEDPTMHHAMHLYPGSR